MSRMCVAPAVAENTDPAAGYSLLELLVVLAIIAVIMAVVPARLDAARPGVEAKASAREFAGELRAARGLAIAGNRDVRVVLDPARKTYVSQAGGAVHRLPARLSIEIGKHEPDGQIAIDFFPDGSSTGGNVVFAEANARHSVAIYPTTGRIAVDE